MMKTLLAAVLTSLCISGYTYADTSSGMPTGKRQHKPLSITSSTVDNNSASRSEEEQECLDKLTPQEGVDCMKKLKEKKKSE